MDAVDGIVAAVTELAAGYEEPAAGVEPTAAPEPPDAADGEQLADAVDAARRARDRLDCDRETFTAELRDRLGAAEPQGAVAAAVWRRASASILGTVRTEGGEWMLSPGEDLLDALARAAEGTTIVLPAGDVALPATAVLLAGVTLRGQGRERTIVRSEASDAGVIVATASLVRLESLTLALSDATSASGLVAGPTASVALSDVRVTGARSGAGGAGGAGVYISAQRDEGAGRGTTLEITDSVFDRNQWAGVAVAGGHRASIQGATFASNGEIGVLFLDSAGGSVTESAFRDNGVAVAATGTADPSWAQLEIRGGSVGAQVDADAAPVMKDLRIRGTSSAAIIFGGESGGAVEGAVCTDTPYGIVVADSAAPTLGDNDCVLARGAF
ncbi:right-handed parallel beta-helix repeat-containing protein [Microbacterium aureliae]